MEFKVNVERVGDWADDELRRGEERWYFKNTILLGPIKTVFSTILNDPCSPAMHRQESWLSSLSSYPAYVQYLPSRTPWLTRDLDNF